MASPSYLLDTNLLVYSYDSSAPGKQERALEVIRHLGSTFQAALPVQVLAEFSNVALYKLEPPLSPAEVYEQIERYEHVFLVLSLTPAVVLEAVRGVKDHSFSYFDAQIWATAKLNQIPVVLSEDFATGATVEGISFINPLDTDFDVQELEW